MSSRARGEGGVALDARRLDGDGWMQMAMDGIAGWNGVPHRFNMRSSLSQALSAHMHIRRRVGHEDTWGSSGDRRERMLWSSCEEAAGGGECGFRSLGSVSGRFVAAFSLPTPLLRIGCAGCSFVPSESVGAGGAVAGVAKAVTAPYYPRLSQQSPPRTPPRHRTALGGGVVHQKHPPLVSPISRCSPAPFLS